MPDSKTVRLRLDGRTVPVHLRREVARPSAHSGRPLAELHGWVTTADAELHHWLHEALQQVGERDVRTVDEQGNPAGRWNLSWNAYAHNAGVHTYTLILLEHEELTLEALEVAGMELHPYEYREEVAGEGKLLICARMMGSEAEVRALRERLRNGERFAVVRHGIQPEPRWMRLGLGEWTGTPEGAKYRLTLVEEGAERAEHPELARLESENLRASLGFYMSFAERLVELLVSRGVVSRAEVDEIREQASLDPPEVRHDLWRVAADIDQL